MFVQKDETYGLEIFLIEPNHIGFLIDKPARFIPFFRDYRSHPGFIAVIGIIIIFSVLALGCGILNTVFNNIFLQQFGTETQGSIVRKWVEGGTRNIDSKYYVSFTYEVEEQPYRRQEQVNLSTFSQLSEGDSVSITYLTNSPSTSKLNGETIDLSSLFPLAIGILTAIIFFYAFRNGLQIYKNEQKLTELGSVLLGKITQTHGKKFRNAWTGAEIQYQFTSPHGKTITGTAYKVSVPLVRGEIPPVGTRIAVLYVNDQLFHIL